MQGIRKFTTKDFCSLYDFMRPLWFETYSKIIPSEQIEFLLDKYFKAENIEKFKAEGYEYFSLFEQGVLVFVERETEVFMDKLYLLPSARGKGIATKAFEFMLSRKKPIKLNVNQQNQRALKCYLKNGFKIIEEKDVILENGMINKDYILLHE